MEKLNDFRSKSGEKSLRKLTDLKKTLRAYKIKNGERNLFENAFIGRKLELEDTQVQAERESLEKFLTRAKTNTDVSIRGNSEVDKEKSYLQKERCD